MSKNVKTQTPQSGIGPRRGNMFAETEYAKDISWTLKRIGLYFVKEKKLISGCGTGRHPCGDLRPHAAEQRRRYHRRTT